MCLFHPKHACTSHGEKKKKTVADAESCSGSKSESAPVWDIVSEGVMAWSREESLLYIALVRPLLKCSTAVRTPHFQNV